MIGWWFSWRRARPVRRKWSWAWARNRAPSPDQARLGLRQVSGEAVSQVQRIVDRLELACGDLRHPMLAGHVPTGAVLVVRDQRGDLGAGVDLDHQGLALGEPARAVLRVVRHGAAGGAVD